MRQLKDRITHSFRMRPLSEPEVGKYLSFRMRAAGYRGPDIFSPRAVAMISKAASGLTRRVNILADKSMLAAFTESKHFISTPQVRAAIRDSDFGRLLDDRPHKPFVIAASTLLAGLLLGIGLHWFLTRQSDETPPPAPRSVRAPAAPPPTSAQPPTAPALTNAAAQPSPEPARVQAESSIVTAPVPIAAAEAPRPQAPQAFPGSRLDADAALRLAAYRAGGNKLLKERIQATKARLDREPDESYSIELFSTDNTDPGRLERFLQRATKLVPLGDVYVLPLSSGGKPRIRVMYGGYPDKDTAAQAAERLPPKYREAFQTELRTFAELRASI